MTEPEGRLEVNTAVGLVERYAAALVSGVPDEPADDGFFGPASVTWRLAADLSAPVAGLRSVLIQALHPLAMAGVDQHSDWQKIREALRELGEEVPNFEDVDPDVLRRGMASEERITTTIDIRSVLGRKRDALFAHGSQISESWFSKIPPEIAEATFGRESFIRAADSTGAPLPEDDLFAGLRP